MILLKNSKVQIYIAVLILMVSVAFAYWNVDTFEFLSLDDQSYIFGNPHVKSGLTWASIKWAFSTFEASNWHPITWMSHMLDFELYGLKPAGHHLTNFLLHLINTLALFFGLKTMTKSVVPSACASLLFGLHPLHVESVAWVSERKDVLSACFMFITIFVYAKFTFSKARRLYFGAILFYILGLLAKPMLVTLPFVLLLIDFWPLRRISFFSRLPGYSITPGFVSAVLMLLREKIPFFVLSVLSCIITSMAQISGGTVASTASLSLFSRLCNAILSYGNYIEKMIYPHNLAFFYPHMGIPTRWGTSIIAVALLAATFLFISVAKTLPYCIMGWLWFLGTLVPVIGIVQIGSQAMADRYTYIPLIGLFLSLSWGLHDLTRRFPRVRSVVIAVSVSVFIILIVQTRKQTNYWKNDSTLAEHALSVTRNNFFAYTLKANFLYANGNYNEAIQNSLFALKIRPSLISSRLNMGLCYLRLQKYPDAIAIFSDVLASDSSNIFANVNCGKALLFMGDFSNARQCFKRVLKKDSLHIPTLESMGLMYDLMHDSVKAEYYYSKIRTLPPVRR